MLLRRKSKSGALRQVKKGGWFTLFNLTAFFFLASTVVGAAGVFEYVTERTTEPTLLEASAIECDAFIPGNGGVGSLTGVINSYWPGSTTVSAGATSIVVGSRSGAAVSIAAGDLLLIMQMQDAAINSTNTNAYGNGVSGDIAASPPPVNPGANAASGATANNNVGLYEYAVATNTIGAGGGTLTVSQPLTNTYTAAAASGTQGQRVFQVIRVPQYSSATVTGTVTPTAWNGSIGGIVAFDVAGNLNFNSQTISADSLGFRGGRGNGAGYLQATTIEYRNANTSSGFKGEGTAGTPTDVWNGTAYVTGLSGYPNGNRALGAPGNAGGGGFADSGGGGGANVGNGGRGGDEYCPDGVGSSTVAASPSCGFTNDESSADHTGGAYGGLGGIFTGASTSRMIMGGGGGGGADHNSVNPNRGNGGLGGGIVMIRTGTSSGTGTIDVDGGTAPTPSSTGNAGGGGAGGTVFVTSGSSLTGVTINARGGAGGPVTNHAPGGGGGGGAVYHSGGATTLVTGGSNGTRTGTAPLGALNATSGTAGSASATATSTDPIGTSGGASCLPSLTVTKTTTTATRTASDATATYTVVIANATNRGTAVGVNLVDDLPSPFTYNGASITPVYAGGATGPASITGTGTDPVTIGTAGGTSANSFTIPADGSVTLTYVVNLNSAAGATTYQNPATTNFTDPTRTASQTSTPGGTYTNGGTVAGSNYSSGSSTGEDVTVMARPTVTKAFSPTSITAGGTSTLTFTLSNSNPVAITGAAFTDTFPTSPAQMSESSPLTTSNACGGTLTENDAIDGDTTLEVGDGSLVLTGGTIPAGSSCAVAVNVTGPSAGTYANSLAIAALTSTNASSNAAAANASLTVVSAPNLSTSTKTENDADNIVTPGQVVTYTMSIINTGGTGATGVTLTDTIDTDYGTPGSFTFSGCGSPSNGSGANISISSISIAASSTCTITYQVTVDNPLNENSLLTNSFNLTAPVEGGSAVGPVAATTLTNNATPVLTTSTITDNDADNFVSPGQTVTFTVTIKNTGDGQATGVDLSEVIDPDAENPTFVSATNCGGVYTDTSTSSNLAFNNFQIDVGVDCVVVYTLHVKTSALNAATIPNSVPVSAADEGGSGTTLTGDTLTVVTPPDLSTSTKTENDADNIVTPGQVVTYTMSIVNSGGTNATGVNLTDTIDTDYGTPGSFTFSGCGSPSNGSGANISITSISINALSTCTITYQVTVDNPLNENTLLTNSFNLSAPVEGGSPVGPVTATTLTNNATPVLTTSTISDDDVDNIVDPGQTVTFTVTIKNTGDGQATGVDLSEVIDPDAENPTFVSATNCGGVYTDTSTSSNLAFNDFQIDVGVDCVVVYTIHVKTSALPSATIPNSVPVSAADEGGSGTTLTGDTFTLATLPNLSTSTKTEDDADNIVTPGQIVTYTMSLINTGQTNATGVNLTDTIDTDYGTPGSFTFSGCGSPSNGSGANISITSISINASSTCTITYQVTVDNPLNESTLLTNSFNLSAPVEGGSPVGPISATTLTNNATPVLTTSTITDNDVDNFVSAGQTVTFTVTIKNTGDGLATGVDLSEVIDPDAENPTFVSATNCGGVYSDTSTSSNMAFNNFQIAVGVDCVVVYTIHVKTSVVNGATIPNSVPVSAADEGGSGATLTGDTFTVVTEPNLSTSTKSENDADNVVTPGQTVTYTLTIVNSGGTGATGVDVDDDVDVDFGTPFNFSFTGCGSSYVNNAGADINIDDLDVAALSSCAITYDVVVDSPLNETETLVNAMTVGVANEGGPGAGPVSATTLTVNATPVLTTSTIADDDADNFVSPGQTVTFTVTIKNTGNGLATGVDLSGAIDPDAENPALVSLTNCGGSSSDTSSPSALAINDLQVAVGTDCVVVYTIHVKNTAANGATIPNVDPVSAANEGGSGTTLTGDTLTVVTAPDLSTSTKSENDSDNIVTPGQTVTYTLTLNNTGGQTATGVDITDDVDSDFGTPFNFSFTGCGGAYVNNAGPDIDIDDLAIVAAGSCVITYDVVVDSPLNEGVTLVNSMTVGVSDQGGPGGGPVSATTLTNDASPVLTTSTITDNDVDNIVSPSQTVTFTVTIKNTGNGLATGVDLSETMDSDAQNTTFISATNCGGSYSDASTSGALAVNDLQIAVGVDCVVVYTIDVIPGAVNGATIPGSVPVSAANEGGTGTTLTPDTLTVALAPNFSTSTKSENDADNVVTPGQTVTYTLTLNNTGGVSATGVDITDDVDSDFGTPFNFSFTTCGSSYINNGGADIDIDDLAIASGGSCVITYDVVVDSPLNETETLVNSMTVGISDQGGLGGGPVSATTLTVDATPVLTTSTITDNDPDNLVDPGQTVTFTVTIKNTGDGLATGVDLSGAIDTDAENPTLVSTTNCGGTSTDTSTASALAINDLQIAVGIDCVVVYTIHVKSSAINGATIPNIDPVSAANEGGTGTTLTGDTLTVVTQPNLSGLSKTHNDGDNIVTPGQVVTYTIHVVNSGAANASGVDLLDLVSSHYSSPGNFNFTNCGSSYINNSTDDVDIEDLEIPLLDECTITYDVTVESPSEEGIVILNSVAVSPATEGGSGGGPVGAPPVTVDVTPVLTTATVVENDNDNIVHRNQLITYTLTIPNTGDGDASGIDVTGPLDADLENLTVVSLTNCGTYTDVSTLSSLIVNDLDIATGSSCVIVYTAEVTGTALDGATIPHTVTVGAADEGGIGATPSADTLVVEVLAGLELTMSVDDFTPNEDQTITYTVTLTNNGPDEATGIEVTALLPAGVTYVSNIPSQGTYTDSTGVWVIGSVADGNSVTLQITVLVDPAVAGDTIIFPGSITAEVEVDPNLVDNSDSVTVVVNIPPVAVDDTATVPNNISVAIPVLDNDSDIDGTLDNSSVLVTIAPLHGVATVNTSTGVITYDPDNTFEGTDFFTYQVCDNDGLCDTAVVTITVTPGGGGGPVFSPTPENPTGTVEILSACVTSTDVTLQLTSHHANFYMVSNDAAFTDAVWVAVTDEVMQLPWTLSAGDGYKTVYVKYQGSASVVSSIARDTVLLDTVNNCEAVPPPPPEEEIPEEIVVPPGDSCTEAVVCADVKFDLYIVNPNGTERHMNTAYSRTTALGPDKYRIGFEDSGIDFDYNDVIIDIDRADCAGVKFAFQSLSATWKHEVRLWTSYQGVEKDVQLWRNTQAVNDKTKDLTVNVSEDILCNEEVQPKVTKTCDVDCDLITYDLVLVNPDGTERHSDSKFAERIDKGDGHLQIRFEDKGIDIDYNDVIIDVDQTECGAPIFTLSELHADWDHKVLLQMTYDGVPQGELLVWTSTQGSVGKSQPVSASDFPALCGELNRPGVTVYEHINYEGQSKTYFMGETDKDLETVGLNDIISSVKVFGDAVLELFTDNLFGGLRQLFRGNDPDLRDNVIGQDTASSLQVVSTTTVTGDEVMGQPTRAPEPEPTPVHIPATPENHPDCRLDTELTLFLSLNFQDDEVRRVQELLQCLGYFPADVSPTAIYGPVTVEAVEDYQIDNNIDPAGYVGPATRDSLNQYVK